MQTEKRGSQVYVKSHWTDQGWTISGVSVHPKLKCCTYTSFSQYLSVNEKKKKLSVWKWNASRDSLTLLHLGGITLLSTESKSERLWLGQKVSR